jgi:hypothetical protein
VPQREQRSFVWCATLLGICLSTVSGRTTLHAQTPIYFRALTVPPRSAGTCLEPDKRRTLRAGLRSTPRLVISSREPDARREMSLVRDSTGAVIGFQEMVQVSTGLGASVGAAVLASLRSDGRITGFLMRSEIQMAARAPQRLDSISLQRMRDSAKHTSSRELLDATGQSQVRVLAAWLAKRCPG